MIAAHVPMLVRMAIAHVRDFVAEEVSDGVVAELQIQQAAGHEHEPPGTANAFGSGIFTT